MLETDDKQVVKEKTDFLINLLIEVGFTNLQFDGERNGVVFVKVIGNIEEDTFTEKVAKLPKNIRVYPSWTGSTYETATQGAAVSVKYARDPSFGIRI